jgi:hypothetical protein
MIALSRFNFHPDHGAREIADRLSRHGLRQGMAAKGWKRPVRGFWYRNQGDGLDNGRGGLETALSALSDSAADQSMMPLDRR